MSKSVFPSLSAMAIGLLLILGAGAGCSTSVGDECDEEGLGGECDDGAICGKNGSGTLECEKVCVSSDQCGTNEECVDVAGGTARACAPRYRTR